MESKIPIIKVKNQENLKRLINHLKKTKHPFSFYASDCIAAHISLLLEEHHSLIDGVDAIKSFLGLKNISKRKFGDIIFEKWYTDSEFIYYFKFSNKENKFDVTKKEAITFLETLVL